MTWVISITALWGGIEDETSVDAPTLGEAVDKALDEFGWKENDEGAMTIKVSGDAGALSVPAGQPIRRKKKKLISDDRNPFEKTDDPR